MEASKEVVEFLEGLITLQLTPSRTAPVSDNRPAFSFTSTPDPAGAGPPSGWKNLALGYNTMPLSSLWREEADKRFPELSVLFRENECDTPYLLWFELRDQFHKPYEAPINRDLINRIYRYADWCCEQPQGETAEDDLATCVAVSFYEHIPESERAIEDMPTWFTLKDVIAMKDIFSYVVGEDGFARIVEKYNLPPKGAAGDS